MGKAGGPKTGGRPKGSLNKMTENLIAKCERLGIDPFEGLLHLSQDEDKGIAMQAYKEICQYIYPKRRAIEVSGAIDTGLMEAVKGLLNLNQDELRKIAESETKLLKVINE